MNQSRGGYRYQKAGVILSEIENQQGRQTDLFSSFFYSGRSNKVMAVMDQINALMVRNTLNLASQVFKQPWKMKQGNKSPGYTTNWDELPVAIS